MIHGESGAGKSWLGDTAPGRKLVLDAEGGSRFTPSQPKIMWTPNESPPAEGDWETTICFVRDFDTMQRVYQWLNSGQHPWDSVTLDSLTEIQKRCLDAVAGTNAPTQQDWGTLLRQMEDLVRKFRDLTMHPTKPLLSVNFITTTKNDNGTLRPHLQGQLGLTLPYFVDVVGYLYVTQDANGNPARQMLTQPLPGFAAKDRTGRLGTVVEHPHLQRIMETIYGTDNLAGSPQPS